MKKVLVYVNREIPFYSIMLQTELLVERLETLFSIKVEYIDKASLSQHINKKNEIILWPIDSFKFELIRFSTFENVVFIYHNITPSKYFWRTEPLVAIRGLLGRMQLRLLRFTKAKWVAVSKYNQEELKNLGIKNVNYSPNLIVPAFYLKSKTKNPSLMFNGRIVQNKGCLELLDIVDEVACNLACNLELYIVGRGKEKSSYYRLFCNKIESLKKTKVKIYWFKGISSEQLSELYSKSWLYVSLAKHEGFGLPVCESISKGTPALYIKCGGQESVLNNIGLCKSTDMSKFITSLLNNENLLAELFDKQYEQITQYLIPNADEVIKSVYTQFISEQ